jgi:hypothetical protein
MTAAVGTLQRAGTLRSARGRIEILDRQGLEAASCPCYRLVQQQAERVLGQATDLVGEQSSPPR